MPILDTIVVISEISEIYYIRKYCNLFHKPIFNFVNFDLIKASVEKTYNEKLLVIKDDNIFKDAKINYIKSNGLKNLEAANQVKKRSKNPIKKFPLKITTFALKNQTDTQNLKIIFLMKITAIVLGLFL